ncbi:MAG: GIY-YIG nuclease family protein, partial [Candidatus Woesebacteria bacterium]|nr:GIY-YIG nuclease family protein [Candidatus Woesebacteria bacterium]
MEISKTKFLKLPESAGVYTFWKNSTPIYIGKSVNLKSRLNSYLDLHLSIKTAQMISEANEVKYIQVTSDLEALLLESSLIKKHKPKYNVVLKDDKHALYIVITKEKFPRVLTSRKFGNYGPFPNSTNVKTIMKMLRKIFPYSDHKLGKKPCFYSHLGLCNPCPNKILSDKDIKIYRKNIKNIKLVLSRKFNIVRKNLEREMKNLSKLEKYEEAKIIREKIKALDYITQKKIDTQKFLENPNLSEDIRREELENLSKITKIKKLSQIECFDISHLAGVSATASMVVMIDGNMENSQYRHFKIKQDKSNSDYDNMREIVKRRIVNLDKWAKPDLIIVDGGLGQVKIFDNEFSKLGILVVGIAKNPDRLVFRDGTKIKLQGLTLQLMSRIRDEAHRFARRYHHLLV